MESETQAVGAFPSEKRYKGWTLGEKSFLLDYFNQQVPKTAKIVELGTGPGYLSYNLLQQGYQDIHCIDQKDYIVFPEVKQRVKQSLLNLDFDRLPFEDESVDVIVAVEVFEHLENIFYVARECQRVLKKEGLLIWSAPYGWSILSRIKFLLDANVIGWRKENTHISFLTKDVFYKCWYKAFVDTEQVYLAGRLSVFGKAVTLPANKWWGRAVCHFMKKRYYA